MQRHVDDVFFILVGDTDLYSPSKAVMNVVIEKSI